MIKDTTLLVLLFTIIIVLGCKDNFPGDLEEYYPVDDWEIISESLDLPPNPYIYSTAPNSRNFVRGSHHIFDRKATIGRVLFYDKSLSADGTVSCGTCHKQELAFSDNVSFSKGVHGNLTARNSFPLGSIRSLANEYYNDSESMPGLFWDNRAEDVEAQIIETMANPNEMGMELDALESVVQSIPYYQSLFALASTPDKDYEIIDDNILECLQSFLRTVNSNESKFDKAAVKEYKFISSTEPLNFTASEHNGKLLFSNNCNQCHIVRFAYTPEGKAITVRGMANNGLDKIYKDKGAGARSEFSSSSEYDGQFKVPDLRNIALTGPYMHDGRFDTLEDVVDHYSEGIKNHKNLSSLLKDEAGVARKFNFTDQEKNDLVNFLHTLTDHDFIKEEMWSDPFKK